MKELEGEHQDSQKEEKNIKKDKRTFLKIDKTGEYTPQNEESKIIKKEIIKRV